MGRSKQVFHQFNRICKLIYEISLVRLNKCIDDSEPRKKHLSSLTEEGEEGIGAENERKGANATLRASSILSLVKSFFTSCSMYLVRLIGMYRSSEGRGREGSALMYFVVDVLVPRYRSWHGSLLFSFTYSFAFSHTFRLSLSHPRRFPSCLTIR